jgi:hypothetical protein
VQEVAGDLQLEIAVRSLLGLAVARVAPRGEARNPAWDVSAIGLLFGTEGFKEGGFLIEEDEEVRCEPGDECVSEEVYVAGKESPAED